MMMKKFIVETNIDFEEEKRLVEVIDNIKKEVMIGDYYHDKIDERIEGFLEALNYLGVKYEVEEQDGKF